MKRIFPIITILLAACGSSAESTDKLLSEVWAKDQNTRHEALRLTKAVTAESRNDLIDSLIVAIEAQEKADDENIKVIDSLLQDGLPQGLSADSYKTIWIVIDHASLEKQEQYLPLIEQMAADGLVGEDEFAILFDRVAMKQNRPQRYGSQIIEFGTTDNLQLYLWPVENPPKIDSLRASVGMSSLASYLEQSKAVIGIEIKYEPTMTIEEINQLRKEKQ